jgi:hypothetical protein
MNKQARSLPKVGNYYLTYPPWDLNLGERPLGPDVFIAQPPFYEGQQLLRAKGGAPPWSLACWSAKPQPQLHSTPKIKPFSKKQPEQVSTRQRILLHCPQITEIESISRPLFRCRGLMKSSWLVHHTSQRNPTFVGFLGY